MECSPLDMVSRLAFPSPPLCTPFSLGQFPVYHPGLLVFTLLDAQSHIRTPPLILMGQEETGSKGIAQQVAYERIRSLNPAGLSLLSEFALSFSCILSALSEPLVSYP